MRAPIAVQPNAPRAQAAAIVQAAVCAEARDVVCERCDRVLCVAIKHSAHPVPLYLSEQKLVTIPEDDYCRFCARPITPTGEAKVPLTGYVAIVRKLFAHRISGHATMSTEVA